MAITETQISRFVDSAIESILMKGKLPNPTEIGSLTKNFTDRLDGGPLFRAIEVKEGNQFPVVAWNKEMEFVEFDLNVLYNELVQQALGLMRRTSYAETTYRSQRGQLDRIIGLLEDLEFTLANSDAGFIGLSDHLTDMSNLNIGASTQGIQNLNEEAVTIPSTPLGTSRIKMDHLVKTSLREVKVIEPINTNVVSSFTAANAPFSNCFQDLTLTWRHDVITYDYEGDVSIQVTFPIANDDSLQQLSRISIIPHSESTMIASIKLSNDGLNFVAAPGGSSVELQNMKIETNLDFARRSARFVRIILKKERPDEQLQNGNRYSFGLRSIALLRAVRAFSATYETIRMTTSETQVEKVALEVDEQSPSGTSIDYYIRAGTGDFLPITPIGRPSGYAPKSLQFGEARRVDTRFTVNDPTIDSTINAVPIYSISPALDTGEMTGEIIYGSAKMWRGRDAWHRNAGIDETSRTIRDSYVHFGTDPEQKLWIWENEEARYYEGQDSSGDDIGVLQTTGDIWYELNSGHRMVPPHNVSWNGDPHPTYAVAEIIAHRSASLNTGEVLVMNIGDTTTLTHQNVDETTEISATVSYGGNDVVLEEGVHYRLGTLTNDENYLDGEVTLIDVPDIVLDTSNFSVTWSYTIAKDITHMVTKIERDRIYLFAPVTADWFETTYRNIPSGIVRNSVTVKSSRGEGETLYVDGKDFRVDADTGTITKLANSLISEGAYIDFQWRKSERSIDTYDTWVYYDKDEPATITFTALGLDKVVGENFFIFTTTGKFDLTDATETPVFTRGWYQFSAVSKPIETAGSAINLILAITDNEGDSIFTGSKYFSEIRAFRSPMIQITENGLKYSTRKEDHTKFAIVDGYVLTNFQPGETNDLITYDYTLTEKNELFELSYLADKGGSPGDVTLRAILKRDPGTDSGVTPKLFWWAIRLRR